MSNKKGNKGTPNVGSQIYIDTKQAKKACKDDLEAVQTKCKKEDDSEKKKRLTAAEDPKNPNKSKHFLSKLKLPQHAGDAANPDAQWINNHCEFLMIKPSSPDELIKQLEDIPNQLAKDLGTNVLEGIKGKAKQKLEEAIKSKVEKMAAKQTAGRLGSLIGGPWVAGAVNVGMTVWGAKDAADMAKEFPDIQKEIESATKGIEEAAKKVADVKAEIDQFKEKYKKDDGTFNAQKAASDLMWGAAELNPCTRAKRCILVPYKETENPQAKKGKGCCPGQTGHHVLPSSMFEGCSSYNEKVAPTMCVEGTTNSHGSHGHIHKQMEKELEKLNLPYGAPITKQQAIDKGADSVQAAFPESGCNPDCIKAQLHSFYDKLNCTPKNKSGLSDKAKSKTTGRGK